MIIGLSGKIGSGKDTVGRMIQFLTRDEEFKKSWPTYEDWINPETGIPVHHPGNTWEIKKFAGKLKQICSLLTGIPVGDLEDINVKNSHLGPEWNYHSEQMVGEGSTKFWNGQYTEHQYTVREMLQRIGTEAMRDRIHQNVWVNALFADYKPTNSIQGVTRDQKFPNWLITDVRFPNEADAVKARGGILVRIDRPGKEDTGTHPSETALDNYDKWDVRFINDGSLEDLLKKVRKQFIPETETV